MKKMIIISLIAAILLTASYLLLSYRNSPKVTLCGKEFSVNELNIDGVDIGKRISYLVNESYVKNPSIDEDNCANILNNVKGNVLTFTSTTTAYLLPEVQLISVFDSIRNLKSWAYVSSTGKIYNTNELDGSVRNELGSLK